MTEREVLIIGGGLSGSALGIALAKAGRSVTLIEKEAAAHDKVCGEFLSWEAVHCLEQLGMDVAALGAVPISVVRLAGRDKVTETRLPFPAWSLSRRRLDEALLAKASASGVTIRRGQAVQALSRNNNNRWQARLAGGALIETDTVFLATGKRDLRGWQRGSGRQNDLLAFKMHYRMAAPQIQTLANAVELIVFNGGYAGLEPIEDDVANLCLLVTHKRFQAVGKSWPDLLAAIRTGAPLLARRLEGATSLWPQPLAISRIPYGYVGRAKDDGLWRLGDQMAVIPSFAGEGMSIALHSARLAATCYLNGETAAQFHRTLARDVRRQVTLATALSQAMVRAAAQKPLAALIERFPALLTVVARATRLPVKAIT